MGYGKFVIFIWALCSFTSLSKECETSLEGKPLFASIKNTDTPSIWRVEQPLFLLGIKLEQNTKTIISPAPVGFPAIFSLPGQEVSEQICVYPQFQFELATEQKNSHLLLDPIAESDEVAILAKATDMWSIQGEENQRNAAQLLSEYVQEPNKSNKNRPLIWLTAINAHYQLSNFAEAKTLLEMQHALALPPKYVVAARLIAARIDLYANETEKALKHLAIVQKLNSEKPLNLNNIIELHLLLSNAHLLNSELSKGEASLNTIQLILHDKNLYPLVNKRLLTEYHDNMGHLELTRFYHGKGDKSKTLNLGLKHEYKASSMTARSGDIRKTISIHSNLAWVYKASGKFNSAIRNFLISLHYLQRKPDKIYQVYLYRNLGSLYLTIGAYDKALNYLNLALPHAHTLTPFWHAKLHCFIAIAHREKAELEQAQYFHDQCVNLFQEINIDGQFDTELLLARIEQAKAHHKLDNSFQNQSLQQLALTKIHEARKNEQVAYIALWLAKQFHQQSQYEQAQHFFNQAIEASQLSATPILRATTPIDAAISMMSFSPEEAIPYIAMSKNKIEEVVKQLDPKELGPIWTHKVNYFYSSLLANQFNEADIAGLFHIHEQSLSHSLRLDKDNASGVSPALIKPLQKISELSHQSTWQPEGSPTQDNIDIQRDLLKVLPDSGDSSPQQTELNRYYLFKGSQHRNNLLKPAVTLQQAQNKLHIGQVLLSYFVVNNHYHSFIVTQDYADVIQLGEVNETNRLINSLHSSVSSPNRNPTQVLSQLSSLIIPRNLAHLAPKEILLIPHGRLNEIPFIALKTMSGDYQKGLISQSEITSIPSATTALNNSKVDAKENRLHLAFFGDPVMKQNNDKNNLPPLPWSKREAENLRSIAADFRSEFYLSEQANRTNLLKKQTREAKILHIATHSMYDPNNPRDTGFTLSEKDAYSGFLGLSELSHYPFDNELVVINGCESALGQNYLGSGLQGIGRTFLVSGSNNVIATMWAISDRASAIFMQHFYRHLKEEGNISNALRKAQLAMQSTPRYSHPFYWAGYTLYSKDNSMINFHTPS